jgi:hypothetical protein
MLMSRRIMIICVIEAAKLSTVVFVSLAFLMLHIPAHGARLGTPAISLAHRDLRLVIHQTHYQFVLVLSVDRDKVATPLFAGLLSILPVHCLSLDKVVVTNFR